MLVIPAVDLKDGKCVRLQQGRADAVTVYSDDPVAMALHWQRQGAPWLHLVDLDAAFGHGGSNEMIGQQIVAAIEIPCQWGGGVRDRARVESLLGWGVRRVVLGTAAAQSTNLVKELARDFGDRIAVGIDARDGRVAIRGWTQTTPLRVVEFARTVADLGVRMIIYTDIATDGMLSGPNLAALAELTDAVPPCQIIASGGVASPADVRNLLSLGRSNLHAVIVGKALYDGRVTYEELVRAAAGPSQPR